jgi:hypothetical protein
MALLIDNSSAYIFKFSTQQVVSDIDTIEISKISALNKYKNEKQHLVIIKRLRSQENVSMNHSEITILLGKCGLYQHSNLLSSIGCCNF